MLELSSKYHIHGRISRPVVPRPDYKENPYTFDAEEIVEASNLNIAIDLFKKMYGDKYKGESIHIIIFIDDCYLVKDHVAVEKLDEKIDAVAEEKNKELNKFLSQIKD